MGAGPRPGAGEGSAAAAAGRAVAAAGPWAVADEGPGVTWKRRLQEQLAHVRAMRCPRCLGALVPLVYGFPSPVLLAGMRAQRLILGGDHLIDNCHVWACVSCNSSFRHYPYGPLGLEELLLQPAQAQEQGAAGGHQFPTYTYEL